MSQYKWYIGKWGKSWIDQKKDSFRFCTMTLVQGKNTIKDFYLKLKEYNKNFSHSEEFLKYALLKGLSSENKIKVLMGGL